MRIITWQEIEKGLPPVGKDVSATIGVFDGLHLGHVELVKRIQAGTPPGSRCAVTFRDNPKKNLRPESYQGCIFTLPQKLEALAALGVDICVLIDFSDDFSKMSGNEFLSVLTRGLHPSRVVIGHDFRCGHQLSTDARGVAVLLSTQGIRTEIVDAIVRDGVIVSSSGIRRAIAEGRLPDAERMLGKPYSIDIGSASTARFADRIRILDTAQVLPPVGRYDVVAVYGDNELPAIADIEPDRVMISARDADSVRFVRFSVR
ncbi:MAG: FAD synthetase family protein [Spirochaetes bacterium]|nr:FAD synthetase family protein [Spirochaetota bacterium]